MPKWLQYYIGGGSLGTPKSDYVICAWPLISNLITWCLFQWNWIVIEKVKQHSGHCHPDHHPLHKQERMMHQTHWSTRSLTIILLQQTGASWPWNTWPLQLLSGQNTSDQSITLGGQCWQYGDQRKLHSFRVFACSRRWARKAYGRPDFITDTILPITHTHQHHLYPHS